MSADPKDRLRPRPLGQLALLVVLLLPLASEARDYAYPLRDRWMSTVAGTPAPLRADVPRKSPLRQRRIRIFEDREVPELLRHDRELRYSTALQRGAAPVVFLIAGTGAAHDAQKNVFMAKLFHERGFHVIALSSPTFPNFVVSASASGVPGHVVHDAEDLHRAMEMTWNAVRGRRSATGFYLAGYSLGALNAAFVAHLDDARGVFDFERVLLINPPVSIYNSISLLDRMIENIPGGADNFDQFYARLARAFSDAYTLSVDDVGFGDGFLARVFQALQPKDEELAALVGAAFRLSSSSMIFTSDVLTDYGFVKPRGLELDRYADLSNYRRVTARLGFTDYYHEFFYPFFSKEYPDMDRDTFIETMGLTSIRDYLGEAEHVLVMHNEDDVILAPGEIDFFREVFGARAEIYPVGGHLGNMEFAENAAHMVEVMAP